jgi:hypothetical protein
LWAIRLFLQSREGTGCFGGIDFRFELVRDSTVDELRQSEDCERVLSSNFWTIRQASDLKQHVLPERVLNHPEERRRRLIHQVNSLRFSPEQLHVLVPLLVDQGDLLP